MIKKTFAGILGSIIAFLSGCNQSGDDRELDRTESPETTAIDRQLEVLAKLDLHLNEGVTHEDLAAFHTVVEIESVPYRHLVEVMGIDLEREPYTPICDPLWMCDYERIEDNGDYISVIQRLERMTGNALGLSDIQDSIDFENESAWVAFYFQGERIQWQAKFDNDWLDPHIIVKYDALLKQIDSDLRIYSNHTDYGQVAFFVALKDEQQHAITKLSGISLILIEKQK